MSLGDETPAEAIAAAILDHIANHPHASDAVEGIARFWLPEALRAAPPETVQRVLDDLVAAGALVCIPVPGGGHRYAAAPGSIEER